jgi:hypothetical protein
MAGWPSGTAVCGGYTDPLISIPFPEEVPSDSPLLYLLHLLQDRTFLSRVYYSVLKCFMNRLTRLDCPHTRKFIRYPVASIPTLSLVIKTVTMSDEERRK